MEELYGCTPATACPPFGNFWQSSRLWPSSVRARSARRRWRLNWFTAELYPQTVMLRELGAPLSAAKLAFVSTAAVRACDTLHLGFLLDPLACRYDPMRDAAVLCVGVAGNGVVGTSTSAACVKLAEATTMNKIWYGQTADGNAADPQVDNGSEPHLPSDGHLWYGLTRGTGLCLLAGTNPFTIATDLVALELQDPTYAQPNLVNATGNGSNRWKTLDYAGLANAYYQGLALQRPFSRINTDLADLEELREEGTKVLSYHGLADDLIMPMNSIHYFTRVVAANGKVAKVHRFNRLFLIPGLAHDGSFGRSASLDPASGAPTSVNKVPLPQPSTGRDELFVALRNWVELGVAPSRIEVSSANGSVTMPLCLYPAKAVYQGIGPVTASSSYTCN